MTRTGGEHVDLSPCCVSEWAWQLNRLRSALRASTRELHASGTPRCPRGLWTETVRNRSAVMHSTAGRRSVRDQHNFVPCGHIFRQIVSTFKLQVYARQLPVQLH